VALAEPTSLRVRYLDRIAAVPRAVWDGLLDAAATPFVCHAFLDALEAAGCAAPRRGWVPRHITLWRGDQLVAAAPAYLKHDHEGDFARDWVWSGFVERAGVRYYPRLFLTVPITPVTGRRVLVAAGEDRRAAVGAVIAAARAEAEAARASSVHVLFPLPEELEHLEAAAMAVRMDFQAHWINAGYADTSDHLARGLSAKARHLVRKERALPARQGITIRTVRGAEIADDRERWGRTAHGFYQATIDKMRWGRPWLNQELFLRIFRDMPEPLELVVAERAGRMIAGAFNVQAGDRLYGRYWGCHEEHDSLHFNVCLHHSVDDCIARGIQAFEGGAGGEHKLHRGFDLGPTHSAHLFLDGRIDREIRRFVALERRERAEELAKWHHRKKKKDPGNPSG
jgi:uncharacterized protein